MVPNPEPIYFEDAIAFLSSAISSGFDSGRGSFQQLSSTRKYLALTNQPLKLTKKILVNAEITGTHSVR
ncbi:MAG: hypothetical protein ACR2H1_02030 [Limisphaerales bacterium]